MGILVGGSVSGIKDVTIATTGTGVPNWHIFPRQRNLKKASLNKLQKRTDLEEK